MRSSVKTLWRRVAIVVASPLILVTLIAIVVLGTEVGTRWTLRQAIQFAPGELVVPEFRGTFLRGLEVPQLQYADDSMQLSASDVYIDIDWIRSSLNRAQLRQLSAGEISYRSFADPAADSTALQITMPELPVQAGASNIRIGSLLVRDHAISDIVIEDFDMRGNRFAADSASASLDAIALTVRELDARLSGDVPVAGSFAWQYADGEWSGEGRIRGSLKELDFEHRLSGAYAASASGKLFLLHRTDPEFDATVSFERWIFGATDLRSGEVHILGKASAYHASVDFELGYEQSLSTAIAGDVNGNLSGLDAIDITANGPAGQLSISGHLVWLPDFFAALRIGARELDPSLVSTLATGRLDADLRLQGSGAESFMLHVDSLDGSYGGEPATARGSLTRDAADWSCAGCKLSLGPNRVALDGSLAGQQLSAQLIASAPALRMLWPGLTGAIEADVQIRGDIALPAVSGKASGTGVAWAPWSATSFAVTSRSSTLEKADLDLSVEGLVHDSVLIGSGTARINGDIRAVNTDLQWHRGEVEASLSAMIAIDEDSIAAELRSASLAEPFAGAWQLSAPTRFSMSPNDLRVDSHAWTNGDATLNVAAFSMREGRIEADATLVSMPLATLNVALPENIRLTGYADAELRVSRNPGGELAGGMRWSQRDTVVRISPPSDAAIDISVPVATAEVTLVGAGLQGKASLEVDPGIQGSLELALERLAADSAITARLRFGGSEWGWIPAFFPEIDNFRGEITTDIHASGKLEAPELAGELRWSNGSLAVPALNVPFEEIEVTVTGSSAGSAAIVGSAKAGSGSLTVEGTFDDIMHRSRSFNIRMNGKEATVLNWPDYQLAASPDLSFAGSAAGIRAGGSISVDRAEISVTELPEGAVSPSDDVSVVGREAEATESIAVSGEVDVVLSENVHISAFGLDTNVEGRLKFTLAEGREPRANGKLNLVNGVFEAYGQRLTIDEGTMTFTGPLDDPVIFVRAVREIESLSGTIRAGIELRGRAQNLSSSVFSSPTMSEADALSYLILGRPLEDATAADGSMLSGTAFALGLRQATVITNQIGQTLGLDQLMVAGNSQSTTALVAGKQLSSRVYLRYAYGVFSQVGNLLLRYKLSKRLTIEAGTGESQSMDLLYIVEKP